MTLLRCWSHGFTASVVWAPIQWGTFKCNYVSWSLIFSSICVMDHNQDVWLPLPSERPTIFSTELNQCCLILSSYPSVPTLANPQVADDWISVWRLSHLDSKAHLQNLTEFQSHLPEENIYIHHSNFQSGRRLNHLEKLILALVLVLNASCK